MSRTFKEALAAFKKELRNGYQAQKNIVDISSKYLDELEAAYSGGGAGGIDYSETEQDTGLKWIDGKAIYQITIPFTSPSSVNTDTSVFNITGAETLIDYTAGFIKRTDGGLMPFNCSYNSQACEFFLIAGTTKITGYMRVNNASDTSKDAYITVKYTKKTT